MKKQLHHHLSKWLLIVGSLVAIGAIVFYIWERDVTPHNAFLFNSGVLKEKLKKPQPKLPVTNKQHLP